MPSTLSDYKRLIQRAQRGELDIMLRHDQRIEIAQGISADNPGQSIARQWERMEDARARLLATCAAVEARLPEIEDLIVENAARKHDRAAQKANA